MLLDSIKRIFGAAAADGPQSAGGDAAAAAASDIDPVHVAACALLLEVAYADGEFSEEEKAHVEGVLERHFDLPPEAGRKVLELAESERRAAIDRHRFTSVLKNAYDLGQKMVLAEVMWGLVLADGRIAEHEHSMARRIANLLDLKPGYLAQAKKAAARGRP